MYDTSARSLVSMDHIINAQWLVFAQSNTLLKDTTLAVEDLELQIITHVRCQMWEISQMLHTDLCVCVHACVCKSYPKIIFSIQFWPLLETEYWTIRAYTGLVWLLKQVLCIFRQKKMSKYQITSFQLLFFTYVLPICAASPCVKDKVVSSMRKVPWQKGLQHWKLLQRCVTVV